MDLSLVKTDQYYHIVKCAFRVWDSHAIPVSELLFLSVLAGHLERCSSVAIYSSPIDILLGKAKLSFNRCDVEPSMRHGQALLDGTD